MSIPLNLNFISCILLQNKSEEMDPQESLHKIVTSVDIGEDYSIYVPDLKSGVLEHISEFQMELETRFIIFFIILKVDICMYNYHVCTASFPSLSIALILFQY